MRKSFNCARLSGEYGRLGRFFHQHAGAPSPSWRSLLEMVPDALWVEAHGCVFYLKQDVMQQSY